MASSRRRVVLCQYSRALPLSSALFFLSTILSSSSLAQRTDSVSTTPPPNSEATTLQTSPSSFASSSPSQTLSPPPAISSSPATGGNSSNKIFNYYFIIVAVVFVVFLLGIMYIGQQRKQKAAMMWSGSQAALARDVDGLRARPGVTMPTRRTRHQTTEGLDDEGEAPPPYHAESKPPSVRTTDGVGSREVAAGNGEAPEQAALSTLARPRPDPPGYHEAMARGCTAQNEGPLEGDLGMARPVPLGTAPAERVDSGRI
ncbi:hypothetical protein BUE80_DR008666 [Diplocarpon rosae]|nr:hypothetical protein BUE80_DR008666 [Diplocarpon rosae]